MEENEKAKLLLLGYNCSNCRNVDIKLTSSTGLGITKLLQKFKPVNIILSTRCRITQQEIIEPKEFVCEKHILNSEL